MTEIGAAPTGPVVDRLPSRAIDRRAIVRSYVHSLELGEIGPRHVRFRTNDRTTTRFTNWGVGGPRPGRDGSANGTLRLDVVAEDVVRVRYAPQDEFDERSSPIVTDSLPPPDEPVISVDGTSITTTAMAITVSTKPFVLAISAPDGRELCRIGGREKNHWSLWDTLNTGVSRTIDDDRPVATECYALRPGEAVYGFGEQFLGGIDKVGQTIDLNMVEATGTTTPRSYKNVPFFFTTHGYGVLWNTGGRTTCWVGSRGAADVQVAIEDDRLDQYIFVGDPKRILDRYTTLTGKAQVPPSWSFGWWQSKISYRAADEVLEMVRAQRAADLPIDVVHLDTHWFREDWRCDLEFDPDRFPDPARFMAELRDLAVHTSLWQLPYIPEGSAFFDELEAAGGFVQHPEGGTYDIGLCYTVGFEGRVGCIDFTNPRGVTIYQRHLRRLFELGASVIKADFGEQSPVDGVYHDGTPGHLAHNLYPLLYNKAVAEVTHDATGEWIMWARSAWAGSQRYPLHWGGDSSPNWDNLGPQLAGGLSLGLSGFSFWSQDIGGFLGETGGDLLIRWVQAGMFLSHARIHGVGRRELAAFGGDVLDISRRFLHLRYRLLPYILGEATRSAAAGLPMARPLVVEMPDDPTTWPIADQWLFGEHLLVAPILDSSGARRVYLPAGRWADWWTGEVFEGPRWLQVDVALDRMPLWIRDGGVIALGPSMSHVGERPTDEVTLRTLAPSSGRSTQGAFAIDGQPVGWRWDATGLHVDDTTASIRVEPVDG